MQNFSGVVSDRDSKSPNTNPALPSFECSSYRQQSPIWRYLAALYEGPDAWMDRLSNGAIARNDQSQFYLPQFERELESNYLARLSRTPFADYFARAIADFVGIIFHNRLQLNLPESVSLQWQSLDEAGRSGEQVLVHLAKQAMIFGHAFVFLSFPQPKEKIVTLADHQAINRRPYWRSLSPLQVINWHTEIWAGKERLTLAVIRQLVEVPDGVFGRTMRDDYLVLRPGQWARYTLRAIDGKTIAELQESGVGPSEIPLYPIYGDRRPSMARWGESLPPLRSLADLNLCHYQVRSDHLHKIHRCCFPQPVRSGVMADEPELVLGVDTCVDVPPGGAFLWAEPQAGSIEQSRKELEMLETQMDFLSAQYLVKPSDRQAAMVSTVQAAKVESSLELFTDAFTGSINQVLAAHCGLVNQPVGSVQASSNFLTQQSVDPLQLNSYVTATQQLLRLPRSVRAAVVELARLRGLLPADFDASPILDATEPLVEAIQPDSAVS